MRSAFLLLLSAVMLTGCAGYQLGPVKPKRMANIRAVAVSSFRNDTLEPRVEVLLANAIIKQLQLDGTYQITDEKHADAIVEGMLDEIDRRPARSVRGNVLLSREYTLTLRAKYKFYRRDNGEVLERRSATGQTSFFVSSSNALTADVNQDERQALPLAAEDLAIRLVSQIAEGW